MRPGPGTWSGVIFGDIAADGGTNGTVSWRVATQQFVPFGSVSPSHIRLAPFAGRTIVVKATTPAQPGDATGSIVLTSNRGGTDSVLGQESTSIAVTLRSQVNPRGGAFRGVLTGGNGRPPGEGQVDYYQFRVPSGQSSITANVSLANDPSDPVGAYLVSPDGDVAGYGQNDLETGNFNTGPISSTPGLSLSAYSLNPVADRWTLIVEFASPVAGNEVSQRFSGNIQLNEVSASAAGLPDSAGTKLAAGTPVTVPVKMISGDLYVDDFVGDIPPYGQEAGDELAAIPYTYTIK